MKESAALMTWLFIGTALWIYMEPADAGNTFQVFWENLTK